MMTNDEVLAENAALRAQIRGLENDLCQASAVLQFVDDVLENVDVGEFAASFPIVQKAIDTMSDCFHMVSLLSEIYPDMFVCDDCRAVMPTNLTAN